jgi:hypothetical protein
VASQREGEGGRVRPGAATEGGARGDLVGGGRGEEEVGRPTAIGESGAGGLGFRLGANIYRRWVRVSAIVPNWLVN